MQKSNT